MTSLLGLNLHLSAFKITRQCGIMVYSLLSLTGDPGLIPSACIYYYYYYFLGNTQLEYYKYMVFIEQKTYKDLQKEKSIFEDNLRVASQSTLEYCVLRTQSSLNLKMESGLGLPWTRLEIFSKGIWNPE